MTHQKFHLLIKDRIEHCPELVSEIIKSVIELIDPIRTKRKDIGDLEKTEKTYIGTKVEIIIRYKLGLLKGDTQDCKIDSTEFDIKCTVGNNWMIPRETVNHFCLLVKINWDKNLISIGTFYASLDVLGQGVNQDQKRSISRFGKETIKWVYLEMLFDRPTDLPFVEWKTVG